MDKEKTVLCLGRIGDILNALPLAYGLSKKGKVNFCVSKDFAQVLERAPYVTPIVFDGPYDKPLKAQQWLRTKGIKDPLICQTHGYFGAEVGKSYQKAAWVAAGASPKFGSEPLVLERNLWAESDLYLYHAGGELLPVILFSGDSISSPFKDSQAYLKLLDEVFPEYVIVDLGQVKAKHPVDLIELYERAEVLVSIDTMHLHLCRAAQVPVVAIINDGWKGSVPPPNAVETFRYADVTPEKVVEAVRSILDAKAKKREIYLVSDVHGTSERHRKAQDTWIQDEIFLTDIKFSRDATQIGDTRNLHYWKDLMAGPWQDDDIVVWTNDDVALDPCIVSWCHSHVAVFGAASMRRDGEIHIGRELFAFTGKWLKTHLSAIPDYLMGEEVFDLGIAAFIRKQRGILTTIENLAYDFYPCDATERYAIHEPHESNWKNQKYANSPAKKHNLRLFSEWFAKNQSYLNLQ